MARMTRLVLPALLLLLLLIDSAAGMYCDPKNCYEILGLVSPADTGVYIKPCEVDGEEEEDVGGGHMADLREKERKLTCTDEEHATYNIEQKAIKKAYRAIAMVWHPDKNASPGPCCCAAAVHFRPCCPGAAPIATQPRAASRPRWLTCCTALLRRGGGEVCRDRQRQRNVDRPDQEEAL